ncbi:thiamine pyrophosphokinase [Corynebacterium lizhenjunii]|uniref:Thiamine pyrophosphokinase n=1 Tax=Corynebacterium lizhenjunii TaxID=2709394 RepID=A0A7T0PAQ8_9CORY|nr:putative cytokinetic ring protein SteA [Corynebacterium lizhenjunii]QPK80143.1 thiamine pyrophosphokinase [Corynebacterium lizhenjunii]
MSLFSRASDLPGIQGTLRDCTPAGKGLKRFQPGDFAVISAADISRQEAQVLVDLQPGAVINAERFSSGAVPNYGPHMLLDAEALLVEGAGAEFLANAKDGKRARITQDGAIFVGEKSLGSGRVVQRAEAEQTFTEAQSLLIGRMEAYFGNAIELIHSEGPLLIDGMGIPDCGVDMRGRKVVVVSPAPNHRELIKNLRNFIREYEPVLVGVDSAADSLVDLGYTPDLIVANPNSVQAETLRCGSRVIVPATPEGMAPGLERIQDLGVGAMTFPSVLESATDLGLLLADFHQASLIVQAGGAVDLDAIFADAPQATPAALLARMKAGTKLVDAQSVISLYAAPSARPTAWLWAVLGVLVALAAIVLIAGFGGAGSFMDNVTQTWANIVDSLGGWIS